MSGTRIRRRALHATGRYLLVQGEVREWASPESSYELEVAGGPPGATLGVYLADELTDRLQLDELGRGVAQLDLPATQPGTVIQVRHGRRSVLGGCLPFLDFDVELGQHHLDEHARAQPLSRVPR